MMRVRAQLLDQAGHRLSDALERRTQENHSILGQALCPRMAPAEPSELLKANNATRLSARQKLLRQIDRLLRRASIALQSARLMDALSDWAGGSGGGFRNARGHFAKLAAMPSTTISHWSQSSGPDPNKSEETPEP